MKSSKRIEWIDTTKAFACLLVVIGHLLMSLRKINPYTDITEYIIWFIYLFHMPLFMCMSGTLYQNKSKIKSLNDYKKFELKKIPNLTIPYVTFYSITIVLNMIFSSSVNTPKGFKEWIGIFNDPISPYWFLYALLAIFIVIPIIEKIFNNNKKIIISFLSIIKILSIFCTTKIFFIDSIMRYGLFFYLGTLIDTKKEITKDKKKIIIGIISFVILSIIVYYYISYFNKYLYEIIMILFALAGTLLSIYTFKSVNNNRIFKSFKEYTFQIFLMHTIFAAGIRILLYKLGITYFWLHLIIGLFVSIYVPVLVSIISNKIKITNFFFFPIKTIEEYKGGKKHE